MALPNLSCCCCWCVLLVEVRDQLRNKTFWNVFFPVCSYLLLFVNVVNLMSNATTPGQQPMLCNCSTTMPSNSSSSTGNMRVTSANHWTVTRLQQASQVTLQRAQELGGVATEWASHTLLVTSAWGSSTLAATRQAAASVQLPVLLQHWLSQLQATLDLLTPQAPPSVYGPHLQPSTGSVSVSPVDPWALHRLAHAASRPQLLQQMGDSVPYASAQQQMQQVMRAAVQGHATLAGTTPAAAAQALQAANAAIAELLSAVQVTLRPLQHQGGASQSPVADNTTCSTQERPTGLPAAASVTAAAAAAPAPAAAPAALHCVLPALHFTQCNVDPAAAGLASCPACNCKGSSSASDELFKMAAEGLQSMEKSIKKRMAPAAAWTTSAIAKAQVRMRERA